MLRITSQTMNARTTMNALYSARTNQRSCYRLSERSKSITTIRCCSSSPSKQGWTGCLNHRSNYDIDARKCSRSRVKRSKASSAAAAFFSSASSMRSSYASNTQYFSRTASNNNNNNNNNELMSGNSTNTTGYQDAFASPPLVVSNGDRLSGPGANRAIKWVPSDAKSSSLSTASASYETNDNTRENYYTRETPTAPQWGQQRTVAAAVYTPTTNYNNNNNNTYTAGAGNTYSGSSRYNNNNNNNNSNTYNNNNNNNSRTFVAFSIYKSKSALSVNVVKPRFESDNQGRTVMKKAGGILLEFAPGIGPRKYDWTKKGTFMLSPVEAAELANRLNPSRATIAQKCEFFHDPGMGGSSQGSVTKNFKMEAMPDGSGGVFLNYFQTKFGEKSGVNIAVSFGELSALELLIKHLVPQIMGFSEEDSSSSEM